MAWSPNTTQNFIRAILQSHKSSSPQNAITLRPTELNLTRTASLLLLFNVTFFNLVTS